MKRPTRLGDYYKPGEFFGLDIYNPNPDMTLGDYFWLALLVVMVGLVAFAMVAGILHVVGVDIV